MSLRLRIASLTFYALRLREAGMIKSSPNKIIADATDWRFFNELNRELKSRLAVADTCEVTMQARKIKCMQMVQNRRRFLATLSSAGAAGLIGGLEFVRPRSAARNDARSASRRSRGICIAPQYVAEELLRAARASPTFSMSNLAVNSLRGLASGEVDFSMAFVAPLCIVHVDAGVPQS